MYYAFTNQIKNDPYAFLLVGFVKDNNDPDGDGAGQGNEVDESLDNIHNHLLATQ